MFTTYHYVRYGVPYEIIQYGDFPYSTTVCGYPAKNEVNMSMSEAVDQLHKKVDSEPSPEPKAATFQSVLIVPGRPGVSTPI